MKKISILVIDDDTDILSGFKALLAMKGYKPSTAETGEETLEMARANYYNLALIDIKLPDMEGTELLSELQQIDPHMKKIIITGYSTKENAIESLNLGADGYIEKPVSPEKLLAVIAEKIEEQEKVDSLYEDTVNALISSKLSDNPR